MKRNPDFWRYYHVWRKAGFGRAYSFWKVHMNLGRYLAEEQAVNRVAQARTIEEKT